MIRYRRGESVRPEPIECELTGYPNKDADGEIQFVNTHFDTKEECWQSILDNAEAHVSLTALTIRDLRARLAKADAEMVDAALHLDDVRQGMAAGGGRSDKKDVA